MCISEYFRVKQNFLENVWHNNFNVTAIALGAKSLPGLIMVTVFLVWNPTLGALFMMSTLLSFPNIKLQLSNSSGSKLSLIFWLMGTLIRVAELYILWVLILMYAGRLAAEKLVLTAVLWLRVHSGGQQPKSPTSPSSGTASRCTSVTISLKPFDLTVKLSAPYLILNDVVIKQFFSLQGKCPFYTTLSSFSLHPSCGTTTFTWL